MNTYTVEFTTFVVQAESKDDAKKMIKKYVSRQGKDLNDFFDQRAFITEKTILLNGRNDPHLKAE